VLCQAKQRSARVKIRSLALIILTAIVTNCKTMLCFFLVFIALVIKWDHLLFNTSLQVDYFLYFTQSEKTDFLLILLQSYADTKCWKYSFLNKQFTETLIISLTKLFSK
jgi:hypothetical protein